MYNGHSSDYSEKIVSTVLQHCRIKYAPCFNVVPHYNLEYAQHIQTALKDFASSSNETGK